MQGFGALRASCAKVDPVFRLTRCSLPRRSIGSIPKVQIHCRVRCFSLAMALMIIPAADLTAPAALSRERQAACLPEARPDRLQGLTPQGDLILGSERSAKLWGLRLPDEGPHRERALAWLRSWSGQPILLQGNATRDRWERTAVRIRLADDSNPLDFAHGLIESGLAIVDSGSTDTFCHPDLLALEETARERSLGVWNDDRYKPIDAEQTDRLRSRLGSFVLVEGRVRSVGERAQRTYLNFGEHWAEDFTIIIPKKTWKLMVDRGLGAAAFKGRRIRARGILEPWQGAALTIEVPEMIERLPR